MAAGKTHLSVYGERLARVVARFRSIGVDLDRGRLRAYAAALAATATREGTDDPDVRKLLWHAACEVEDLEAAASLSDDALEAVCAGDLVFTSTSGLDQGRNLCFELVTAAKLGEVSGHRSALQAPSDAVNEIEGQVLLVECKRPSTSKGLGRCITDGYRQLSEHKRAGANGIGALSVEVTALANPDFGVFQAPNREAAINGLYRHILRVFAECKDPLTRAGRNIRSDANVHMMMFRLKCMSGNGGPPDITTIWQLQPVVPLNSPDFARLYRFMRGHPDFSPGVTYVHQ